WCAGSVPSSGLKTSDGSSIGGGGGGSSGIGIGDEGTGAAGMPNLLEQDGMFGPATTTIYTERHTITPTEVSPHHTTIITIIDSAGIIVSIINHRARVLGVGEECVLPLRGWMERRKRPLLPPRSS
uniref:Uncharacterized protein n=1 Tax=Anopheles melas TaxID=34690 RepID=A0A182UCC2_9DIPT